MQFGDALVVVIPVIRKVCPLLAEVSRVEVKLAAPEPFATTPVTAVCATLLMLYSIVEVLFAPNPVKLIVADEPAQTAAVWVAPDKVGVGFVVTDMDDELAAVQTPL